MPGQVFVVFFYWLCCMALLYGYAVWLCCMAMLYGMVVRFDRNCSTDYCINTYSIIQAEPRGWTFFCGALEFEGNLACAVSQADHGGV